MDCQLLHRKKLSFFHCFIMMGIDFTFLDMFLYNRLLFAIVLTYWFWIAILLCLVLVFVVVSLETCNIKSNLLKTIKFIFFFRFTCFHKKGIFSFMLQMFHSRIGLHTSVKDLGMGISGVLKVLFFKSTSRKVFPLNLFLRA